MSSVHNRSKAVTSVAISLDDSTSVGAFGRLRVVEEYTIFDSKQIFDNKPLLWDDQEESGGGTTSSHSVAAARTRMSVSSNTAGVRTRQTFMRFNYQPGKSMLVILTMGLGNVNASGTKSSVGIFDDDNGIFCSNDGGTLKMVIRSSVSGSVVDNEVPQSSWNKDTFDGNGPSGIEIDTSNAQILFIDYEWLGIGRVRTGFFIGGNAIVAHEFLHSNIVKNVYMSTPNLPLRYQISNDGTGPGAYLDHICSTVISEGGRQDNGTLRYKSTAGTHVDANDTNSIYAVVGVRLKSTHIAQTVAFESMSMINQTGDDFEWLLIYNPTVAGSFTYSNETNSSTQTATGATANTVTGGTTVTGGFVKASGSTGSIFSALNNAIRLGAYIDGTPTTMVLCVRPLSANANIEGSLTWRELA